MTVISPNVIAQFLASKGLPRAAIAAAIGNMMVESSLDTGAYNAGEGAVGLVQWEGGRLTALQHYARSRNLNETDPQTQLGFLWQELSGPYSHVLHKLMNATDPGQAAAIWDGEYEVSSGSSRGQRISNAVQWFNSGGGTTQSGQASPSGSYTNAGSFAGSPTPLSGGGVPVLPHLTAAQYKAALANVAGAIDSVPELKALLDKQLHAPGGGSIEAFQNDVENSRWWKTHADSARQQFALSISDPATFRQNMNAALGKVHRIAGQSGAQLKPGQDVVLARRSLFENLDDQALSSAIVETPNLTGLTSVKGLTGQIAAGAQQLQQLTAQYGQFWGPNQLAYRAQQIVAGKATMDGYKQMLINQASAKYPGLVPQLQAGHTVEELAAPYVDSMSKLLELSPTSIKWQTDTLIQKALQGQNSMAGSQVKAETIPVWQYENWVRKDPRWGQTNNAKASAASALMQLGKAWGFE